MDKKPIINAYIGTSGSGKTYKALLDIAKYPRQIRLDAQPLGNKELQKNCDVVRTIPELLAYVKAHNGGGFKVCLWPKGVDLKTAFHWVCKIAMVYRKIAILADEANRYIDKNLCEAGEAVFFQSRHSQTRLFYTMFNPRYVSPEMRGNTSEIYLFKSHEENFTSYLKTLGASPKTVDAYLADDLPKYSFALCETGQRPVIVSPVTPKPKPKKKSAARNNGGRRAKK